MYKVCLDAGHANTTAGKRTPIFKNGTFFHESEQNYPIMFKVAEYLKYNGFDVCYTNTDINYDMSLQDRVKKEQTSRADIFISIHKNAIKGKWQSDAKGIETFIVSRGGRAEKLANCVHSNLIKDTSMKDRKVKTANFYVIKYTKAPAILVELGFMDYEKEAWQMKSDWWYEKYAKAITKGVCSYFGVAYKEKPKEDFKKETKEDKKILYRVMAGSYSNKENAEKQVEILKSKGINGVIMTYEG